MQASQQLQAAAHDSSTSGGATAGLTGVFPGVAIAPTYLACHLQVSYSTLPRWGAADHQYCCSSHLLFLLLLLPLLLL